MWTRLCCVTLCAASALAACGSDTTTHAAASRNGCSAENAVSANNITVQNFAFVPTCVKVAAGSSLTFINKSVSSHTVSSDTGAPNVFDNTAFDPNGVVTQTFGNAGATGVHCNYHAQMTMTVIVA